MHYKEITFRQLLPVYFCVEITDGLIVVIWSSLVPHLFIRLLICLPNTVTSCASFLEFANRILDPRGQTVTSLSLCRKMMV